MPRTKVFVSYSHVDGSWLAMFATHVAVLQRQGLIDLWSDTRIEPGSQWERDIEAALTSAKVAVLLISPDFLASAFIWDQEMPRIIAHGKAGMSVLPLIARPCAWRLEPELAKLQARPVDGRPLSSGSEAQIDQDLSALAYELAAKVGRSPVADESLAVNSVSLRGERRAQGGGRIPALIGTWTGQYNGVRPIRLVVRGASGRRFQGTMEYPQERTLTSVEGEVLEQVSGVDPQWTQLGVSSLAPDSLALMFRETGYEKRSEGSISFEGEYRAVLRQNELVGAWFSDGRLVGSLRLHRTP